MIINNSFVMWKGSRKRKRTLQDLYKTHIGKELITRRGRWRRSSSNVDPTIQRREFKKSNKERD
jgi:hypothetical protein